MAAVISWAALRFSDAPGFPQCACRGFSLMWRKLFAWALARVIYGNFAGRSLVIKRFPQVALDKYANG